MVKIFIVNTNISNSPVNELNMLSEEKVAAYYSPWKYSINEMEANDIVYLYSNGRGIIARGIATGIIEKSKDQVEHYMNLDRFEKLKMPLESSKIVDLAREVTDEDFKIKWNQTMIHLPNFIGIHIWQSITHNNL